MRKCAMMIGALGLVAAPQLMAAPKKKPLPISFPKKEQIYYAPAPPMPPPRYRYAKTSAVLKSGSISAADYPSAAMHNWEEGVVNAHFEVGEDGRVSTCFGIGGTPLLQHETCAIIKRRFRFSPALDDDNKPVHQSKMQPVTWYLPMEKGDDFVRTARKFANAYKVTIDLDVDEKGKVTSCATRNGVPNASRDAFVCGLAKEQWSFAIAKNDKGKPVASQRSFAPDLPLPKPPETAPAATDDKSKATPAPVAPKPSG